MSDQDSLQLKQWNSQQRLIHMSIDCLNHTDREEGWIQGFQSLMECKIYSQKLMPQLHALHHFLYYQH